MNALFHKGFFKEKFRQLRTAGLISGGILALITLIGTLISFETTNVPGATAMARNLMSFAYIMGFILTLSAFKWLNKRATSDFHHALPVSRRAMYFSTFAAIMLWLVIGIGVTAVIKAGFALIFNRPFNYLLFLCVLVNVLITCLTVVAGVSLACALTGTRFFNFFAALVILFLPRIMLMIFGGFVADSANSISLVLPNVSFLFDPSYNITGTYPYSSALMSYISNLNISYTKPLAMLYSFAYAALLTLLGCIAFVKRRSEDAGTPCCSRILQTVIGCAFGLPLLLVAGELLRDGGFGVNIGSALILALVAFVIYCLYHLISTKSFNKMCRAIPLFAICIGVAALYYFLPPAVAKAEENIKLSAEDIKSFSIENIDGEEYSLFGLDIFTSDQTYEEMVQHNVSFTDDRGKAMVARAFSRLGADSMGYSAAQGEYNTMLLRIDRKHGKDLVRYLTFYQSEAEMLESVFQGNAEYADAETDYPQGRLYYSAQGLDNVSSAKLGKQFAEEYAQLSKEQIKSIKTENGYSISFGSIHIPTAADGGSGVKLGVSGCRGVENFENSYYILPTVTPKTAKMYVELVNDKGYDKGAEVLEKFAAGEDMQYASVTSTHCGSGAGANYSVWSMDGGSEAQAYRELAQIYARGTKAEDMENAVYVECSDGTKYYSFFKKLTPEDEERALELINEIYGKEEYGEYYGSFTIGSVESPDGKYFAVTEQMGSAVVVGVYDNDTGDLVSSFAPARAMDFHGVCWEEDSYNIWIQSGDIGVKCYRYDDGVWVLDETAERPDYIFSIYDD